MIIGGTFSVLIQLVQLEGINTISEFEFEEWSMIKVSTVCTESCSAILLCVFIEELFELPHMLSLLNNLNHSENSVQFGGEIAIVAGVVREFDWTAGKLPNNSRLYIVYLLSRFRDDQIAFFYNRSNFSNLGIMEQLRLSVLCNLLGNGNISR
uniref:Uncharacterized protein n=1 Tax=Glossina brevipalpis TaxID=37001 RepID=A0A1A9WQ89_9MUSC